MRTAHAIMTAGLVLVWCMHAVALRIQCRRETPPSRAAQSAQPKAG